MVRRLVAIALMAGAALPAAADAKGPYVVVASKKPAASPGPAPTKYGITRDDFERMAEIPAVTHALPLRTISTRVRYGEREVRTLITGATPELANVRLFAAGGQIEVQRGRFLSAADLKNRNSVAVLTAPLARTLFGVQRAIGQSVRVADQLFVVVGVLNGPTDGASENGANAKDVANAKAKLNKGNPLQSSSMYIPISTMRARLGDRHIERRAGAFEVEHVELSHVCLTVDRVESLQAVEEVVRKLLAVTHETQDYTITIVR